MLKGETLKTFLKMMKREWNGEKNLIAFIFILVAHTTYHNNAM